MSAKKGVPKIGEQEMQKIFDLFYNQKKSQKEISEITGRNQSAISRVLSKMIFAHQESHKRHFHHSHASLAQ